MDYIVEAHGIGGQGDLPISLGLAISGAVAAETTTLLVPLGQHVLRGIAAPCTVFTMPDAELGAFTAS